MSTRATPARNGWLSPRVTGVVHYIQATKKSIPLWGKLFEVRISAIVTTGPLAGIIRTGGYATTRYFHDNYISKFNENFENLPNERWPQPWCCCSGNRCTSSATAIAFLKWQWMRSVSRGFRSCSMLNAHGGLARIHTHSCNRMNAPNRFCSINVEMNVMRRPRTVIQDKNERPTTDDWETLVCWMLVWDNIFHSCTIRSRYSECVCVCGKRALDIFVMTSIHIFHALLVYSIRIHSILSPLSQTSTTAHNKNYDRTTNNNSTEIITMYARHFCHCYPHHPSKHHFHAI